MQIQSSSKHQPYDFYTGTTPWLLPFFLKHLEPFKTELEKNKACSEKPQKCKMSKKGPLDGLILTDLRIGSTLMPGHLQQTFTCRSFFLPNCFWARDFEVDFDRFSTDKTRSFFKSRGCLWNAQISRQTNPQKTLFTLWYVYYFGLSFWKTVAAKIHPHWNENPWHENHHKKRRFSNRINFDKISCARANNTKA